MPMNLKFLSLIPSNGQWTRADVERLVSTKPQNWGFGPPSHFADDSLAPLANATKLARLSFYGCHLSRENLRCLAAIPALQHLDLRECDFSPADLSDFCEELAAQGSLRLKTLQLTGTSVGDVELLAVGKIVSLQTLHLNETKVSDAGLEHLRSLKKLEILWLDGTRVSDKGVLRLAILPRLWGLPARNTACSNDIRARLFEVQLALAQTKKKFVPAQAQAAEIRLRDFLREYEAWQRDVAKRANDIEKRFRPLRAQSNVFTEDEWQEKRHFFVDISASKSVLATRFCSTRLLSRGAGGVWSYSHDEPPALGESSWLQVGTLSPITTVFVAPPHPDEAYGYPRRYTMTLELGEWKLDEVQHWAGGWKRDTI